MSSADKAFIKDAAKGGMMEVAMGLAAEKNASNSEVKNVGARRVKDHSKANEDLKAIAKEEGVEWPAEKEAGKWKSDKDYMDAMVKDHEKDLAAFEKEAKNVSDPDVKNFASKTAEIVRKHLERAERDPCQVEVVRLVFVAARRRVEKGAPFFVSIECRACCERLGRACANEIFANA